MSDFCDESYTVHRHEVRTARKQHKCSACKLPILPGHRYAYVFTLYDGKTETFRRCGACEVTWQHLAALCDASNDAHRDFGGGMYPREDLSCGLSYEGEWENEPPDEIAALPFLSDAERGALLPKAVQP